jgi:hypothetical protein
MTKTLKLYALLACLLAAFVLGLGLGWKLWVGKTKTVLRDVPGPTVYLPGGAVVLAKKVENLHAKPTIKQETPDGSTTIEEGTIVVQPKPPEEKPAVQGQQVAQPPAPITVNFAIVKMPDNTRRVVASSPDGTVTGGIDIVDEPLPPPPKLMLRAAGIVYGTTAWGDTAKGAFYDHDWKMLRFGGEVTKNTYATVNRTGWEGRVKIGVIF